MSDTKILYGVCGIGMGHTLRQTPIIDHLAQSARMVIFGYGESYRFFKQRYLQRPNVRVAQVSVPFYVGGPNGLDFARTAQRHENFTEDALSINCVALHTAQQLLGKPDLVVTDYEPTSAQYAYATGAPLVTIDQQSKYLVGQFPANLQGLGYADEVQRLRMFFPRAEARFACSFFRVPRLVDAPEKVQLVAPNLTGPVLRMRGRTVRGGREVLVYLSSQQQFNQSVLGLIAVLASQPHWNFHLFVPGSLLKGDEKSVSPNVSVYAAGDAAWNGVLERCAGIITTAGHSLLSEAMYLRKPVYALPLPVYEQQMNAHVIDSNGFGISRPQLTEPQLAEFLGGIGDFRENISKDKNRALLRGAGQDRIVRYLERTFLS